MFIRIYMHLQHAEKKGLKKNVYPVTTKKHVFAPLGARAWAGCRWARYYACKKENCYDDIGQEPPGRLGTVTRGGGGGRDLFLQDGEGLHL